MESSLGHAWKWSREKERGRSPAPWGIEASRRERLGGRGGTLPQGEMKCYPERRENGRVVVALLHPRRMPPNTLWSEGISRW